MSVIGRSGSDSFKEFGWIILVVALVIGFWLTSPMMSGTGSESVDIVGSSGLGSSDSPINEQSLSSLDPQSNPQGAPGGVIDPAAAARNKSAATTMSSLYQPAGGAAGEPVDAKKVAEMEKEEGGMAGLSQAMAQVAKGGNAPDNSWGGKKARTGFSRPKAKFGKVGTTRGGGKGSSSAHLKVKKAFGTGGDPGLSFGSGGGASGGPRRRMNKVDGSGAGNRGLQGLKNMNKMNLDSLKGKDERAASGGRRTFDASGGHSSAMSALQAAGGAAGLAGDDGSPMNLKSNNYKKINKKEFEPPELKAKEVDKSDNKEYMQQKMMMMVLQAALTGIMGPIGGAVGGMMDSGLGAKPDPGTTTDHNIGGG